VFDLGGGTFDVSILEVGEGVVEVKSTAGDTFLGGDDWDQSIVDYVAEEFKKDQGIDLRNDRQALQRLKEAAEKAKVELSQVAETEINLPFVTADASGPKHLQQKLTRARFEQLTEDLVQRLRGPFKQALGDAGLRASEIHEVVLVGGATRMPMVQDMVRDLTGGKEPHKGVNPDEVVAVGAALQAGVLGGEVEDIVLLDVTPLSLGVETLGGVFTKLIERNTTIPTREGEIFSTAEDGQTAVDIKVFQGERPMARDNMLLGQFRLDGIPPAQRGIPQVEVTFDIDANGILNVSAQDKATGKEQNITIQASTNLTDSDIEHMVKEAAEHRAEDEAARKLADARNQGDNLAYQMDKMLKEQGDKAPQDLKDSVQSKIEAVREAIQGDNLNRINAAIEDLQETAQQLGQQMYQAAGAPPSGDGGAPPSGEDEDVVEGEYREP